MSLSLAILYFNDIICFISQVSIRTLHSSATEDENNLATRIKSEETFLSHTTEVGRQMQTIVDDTLACLYITLYLSAE